MEVLAVEVQVGRGKYIKTEEHKKKIALSLLGHKISQSTKDKISFSLKGRHISKETEFKKGLIPWNWKGDMVGNKALHKWIKKKKGIPSICENCGSTENVVWSNISYEYKRDLLDWEALCQKCHMKKDYANGIGKRKTIFDNNGIGRRLVSGGW